MIIYALHFNCTISRLSIKYFDYSAAKAAILSFFLIVFGNNAPWAVFSLYCSNMPKLWLMNAQILSHCVISILCYMFPLNLIKVFLLLRYIKSWHGCFYRRPITIQAHNMVFFFFFCYNYALLCHFSRLTRS
jgi:hypothetical protein